MQSPAFKSKFKSNTFEQFYQNEHKDENVDYSNMMKMETIADNMFFASPLQKKKLKMNPKQSPNMNGSEIETLKP